MISNAADPTIREAQIVKTTPILRLPIFHDLRNPQKPRTLTDPKKTNSHKPLFAPPAPPILIPSPWPLAPTPIYFLKSTL